MRQRDCANVVFGQFIAAPFTPWCRRATVPLMGVRRNELIARAMLAIDTGTGIEAASVPGADVNQPISSLITHHNRRSQEASTCPTNPALTTIY